MSNSIMDNVKEIFLERQESFRRLFHSRNEKSVQVLGEFLHYHLLVEKLIVDYIQAVAPNVGPIADTLKYYSQKLTFALKLPDCDEWFKKLGPALRQLNTIRNDFAHEIEASELPSQKLDVLRQAVKENHKDDDWLKPKSDIDLVRIFVIDFSMAVNITHAVKLETRRTEIEYAQIRDQRITLLEEQLDLHEEFMKSLDAAFPNLKTDDEEMET